MNDLTSHARGTYQRDILTGRARISGSDLTGRAARYGGRYRASRDNLINRIRAAGHVVTVEARPSDLTGRRVNVLIVDGRAVSRAH